MGISIPVLRVLPAVEEGARPLHAQEHENGRRLLRPDAAHRHRSGEALPGRRHSHPRPSPNGQIEVEVGVQIVQRFVLAVLRYRTFFRLVEANAVIRERLELLSNRPFRKLPGTMKSRSEKQSRCHPRPSRSQRI